jgi:hypothetical protein
MPPKREQAPLITPTTVANGLSTPETALQALSQLSTTVFSEVRHSCSSARRAGLCMQQPVHIPLQVLLHCAVVPSQA